jgi:hypothetical protein
MTDSYIPTSVAAIAARGRITPDDVKHLRATVYGDPIVSADEARWAMLLNDAAKEVCLEWTEFFTGALTDFIVRHEVPEGYISEENARWLIEAISRDGVVKSSTELELLVRVLELATSSPATLSSFALRQVAEAVIHGKGPLTEDKRLTRGTIGAVEVELIRRILHAFGGYGAIGVTREEAEVLFDLNDQTSEANNDSAWSDLFVKAVANFLMAARGYSVLSGSEALARGKWLDAPTDGITALFGDVMSTLLSGGLKGIWAAWRREESEQSRRLRETESEIRAAEIISCDEARWLADRIGRDGVVHANERALLQFLRDESPDVHPSLRTLIDTAA